MEKILTYLVWGLKIFGSLLPLPVRLKIKAVIKALKIGIEIYSAITAASRQLRRKKIRQIYSSLQTAGLDAKVILQHNKEREDAFNRFSDSNTKS